MLFYFNVFLLRFSLLQKFSKCFNKKYENAFMTFIIIIIKLLQSKTVYKTKHLLKTIQ